MTEPDTHGWHIGTAEDTRQVPPERLLAITPLDGGFVAYKVGDPPDPAVYDDEPDTPKLLRDMSNAEVGALVRAKNEGKVIECCKPNSSCDGWVPCEPEWHNHWAYRVKPEPKRETVELLGGEDHGWGFYEHKKRPISKTHRITFDLIDGKPIEGVYKDEHGNKVIIEAAQ